MRRAATAIAGILIASWCAPAEARAAPKPRQPVVVELYTSQGCSSCVAADKLLVDIAGRPNTLALTFAVDYWDYLGWTDTFAKPEFSDRQKAFNKKLALRDVYTPQVIVNGADQASGAEAKRVEALIRQAQKDRTAGPRIRTLRHSRISVAAGPRPQGGADVWLVRYDPSVQEVAVKRGENRGQTLAEKNVVRTIVRLGAWTGKARTYVIPADGDSKPLKSAVLVQTAHGGRILSVLVR
jgi:hypothetical protein